LRGVLPNKIALFAKHQTVWPPKILGLATPLELTEKHKHVLKLTPNFQNRRQKVVNRGLCVFAGGLYIRAGVLDIQI